MLNLFGRTLSNPLKDDPYQMPEGDGSLLAHPVAALRDRDLALRAEPARAVSSLRASIALRGATFSESTMFDFATEGKD